MPEKSAASIARLNDMLRTKGIGGEVFATPGVTNLSHDMRARVLIAIKEFNDFDEPNDPYREHDFGAVEIEGQKFFFKIDTYDLSYQYMSEDPTDPNKTRRVMTIMKADEY